jgi:hypothetical protein
MQSAQIQAKTIRHCKVCMKETPHEILSGGGCVAKICVPCLERSQRWELDRD